MAKVEIPQILVKITVIGKTLFLIIRIDINRNDSKMFGKGGLSYFKFERISRS